MLRHVGLRARPHVWTTKVAHWVAGGLALYAGFVNGDDNGALFDDRAMSLEVLVGVAVTAAWTFLWFWVRGVGGGPRLAADAPLWERHLARFAHAGLYLGIAAALASGFAMAWFVSSDVVVDPIAKTVLHTTPRFALIMAFHNTVADVLGGLLILHLCGAAWHRVVRRDGVMESMSLLGTTRSHTNVSAPPTTSLSRVAGAASHRAGPD